MKKILAILLAALLISLTFAGCGEQSAKAELTIIDEAFEDEFYGIGFRKSDTELLAKVQGALDAMAADGTTKSISEKWFGEDLYFVDDAVEPDPAPEVSEGTLIVGFDIGGFPPMGFTDEAGNYVGFDLDLAAEVCKRIGYTLQYQQIDWASKEMELASGNIDCIWNGMSITPERQEMMLISKPYLKNRQIAVVNANGTDITSLADLKGKKIAVQNGSPAYTIVEQDADLAPGLEGYPDYLAALTDLEAGRVDAVVGDEVLIRYQLKNR